MRLLIPLAFFLGTTLPSLAQTAPVAQPGQMKDPRAILAAAEPYYDFSNPALKPFHLKANYQLYDDRGKPKEQGTFEYWWASPKVYRRTWTRPDASRSEWYTADGAIYRKESGEKLRYFERNIVHEIFAPLPAISLVDSGNLRLEFKNVKFGSHALPCVIAIRRLTENGKPKELPSSSKNYCFDPSVPALLITSFESLATEYKNIAEMQNHYLARDVDIFANGVKSFTLTLGEADSIAGTDKALTPDPDAMQISPRIAQLSEDSLNPDANRTKLLKKVLPVYPAIARMSRVQGTVVIGATINKEGRVQDIEVVASPSALLTNAAVDAVKQWQYKPTLVNGTPVEVDTTIDVIFTIGG